MELVGYARASTEEQDLNIQIEALEKAGCTTLFTEKKSGASLNARTALDECITYLRKGDTLMVTRVDRLTRSILDLQMLHAKLQQKKVHLKATEQPIDTGSASGKAFLDMLGVFSEFETNIRRERQLEGVSRAKKEGKYKGRKPTAQAKSAEIIELTSQGLTRQAIAKKLSIGIASVYRAIKTYRAQQLAKNIACQPVKKIAAVEVSLQVENNSKYVRGKAQSRREIEQSCFAPFDMVKKHKDSWEYLLKIPYENEAELDEIIYGIMEEAGCIADMRNGYAEISIIEPETQKSW